MSSQIPPTLTVRRLHADLSQGFARHWCAGDAFLSAFCNALSMSFPVGEQFFIDAVKAGARALPNDASHDALRETVRLFVGQEATHRHLHTLYNAHLERQGLVNHWGPRALRRIQANQRRLQLRSPRPHVHQLAITAAYEHLTAVLGELTLAHRGQPGDWFAQADEPLRTLWRWHAAEESEHKCVAFDLYLALGGSHRYRRLWYGVCLLHFALDATRQTWSNLWHDGSWWRPSTWRSALRFFWGRHGMVWRTVKPLLAYLRSDFHPMQLGHADLAADWLNEHAHQWSAVGSGR